MHTSGLSYSHPVNRHDVTKICNACSFAFVTLSSPSEVEAHGVNIHASRNAYPKSSRNVSPFKNRLCDMILFPPSLFSCARVSPSPSVFVCLCRINFCSSPFHSHTNTIQLTDNSHFNMFLDSCHFREYHKAFVDKTRKPIRLTVCVCVYVVDTQTQS